MDSVANYGGIIKIKGILVIFEFGLKQIFVIK